MLPGKESDPAGEAAQQLLRQVSALTQRLRMLEAQVESSTAELTAQREAFSTVSTHILRLEGATTRLAERERKIAELEAAALEAEKRDAELMGLKGHAERVETALAAARGLVAAQNSRVVYLEGEVNARLWRKVLSYARRKLRSR